jgi:hypothetical protein
MMLQVTANSSPKSLIELNQKERKSEFMPLNTCGSQLWEAPKHVKVLDQHHYGMLITMVQHHSQISQHLEDGQNHL